MEETPPPTTVARVFVPGGLPTVTYNAIDQPATNENRLQRDDR